MNDHEWCWYCRQGMHLICPAGRVLWRERCQCPHHWRALYEESDEPPKPIPPHVVTVWDEDGTMQMIDGSVSAP